MQHLDINMAEDELNIEDEAIALEDAENTEQTDMNVSSIVDHVIGSFKKSEDYRYEDEQRWIRAYRNYRVYMDLMFNLRKQKNLEYL